MHNGYDLWLLGLMKWECNKIFSDRNKAWSMKAEAQANTQLPLLLKLREWEKENNEMIVLKIECANSIMCGLNYIRLDVIQKNRFKKGTTSIYTFQ